MISASARFLINVESLNGVESVGNLTKHRTAPVVLKTSNGYLIRYVPVISGESLAHAYQANLVDIAKSMNLPVGKNSSEYEFIKFATNEVLEGIDAPKDYKDARRFEVDVMLKDVVADIGGFMYAGNVPVRRTSRIKFGYMIPALTGEELPAQLEAQFHVRYSSDPKERQAIFNVEVASALYTLSFSLDEDLIAVPSTAGEKVDKEDLLKEQKNNRTIAAIRALYPILTGNFGGKRSRFLPSMKLMSMIITVSDFPFVAEPGHNDDYIKISIERFNKAKEIFKSNKGEVYVINNENLIVEGNVKIINTPEDLLNMLEKSLNNQLKSG